MPDTPHGSVTLVATPIGNLEDITLRAVRLLREADIIACEDTRRTGRLLEHLEIPANGRLTPFHEHNERQRAASLVERVVHGAHLVLVSDAGTPGICDPGFILVRACVGAGVPVTAAPGPCAAVVAATLTGLPVHAIALRGFPPRKAGQRLRFSARTLSVQTPWSTMRAVTACPPYSQVQPRPSAPNVQQPWSKI